MDIIGLQGSVTVLEAVIELSEARPCRALWNIVETVFDGIFSKEYVAEKVFRRNMIGLDMALDFAPDIPGRRLCCGDISNIYPMSGDYHLDALLLIWHMSWDITNFAATEGPNGCEITEG